jgi:hypothetical protein
MSLMYADLAEVESASLAREYRCWALSQVRYMLGDAGRSLLVGYGKNPPKRTQDRAAACPEPPEVREAQRRLSVLLCCVFECSAQLPCPLHLLLPIRQLFAVPLASTCQPARSFTRHSMLPVVSLCRRRRRCATE